MEEITERDYPRAITDEEYQYLRKIIKIAERCHFISYKQLNKIRLQLEAEERNLIALEENLKALETSFNSIETPNTVVSDPSVDSEVRNKHNRCNVEMSTDSMHNVAPNSKGSLMLRGLLGRKNRNFMSKSTSFEEQRQRKAQIQKEVKMQELKADINAVKSNIQLCKEQVEIAEQNETDIHLLKKECLYFLSSDVQKLIRNDWPSAFYMKVTHTFILNSECVNSSKVGNSDINETPNDSLQSTIYFLPAKHDSLTLDIIANQLNQLTDSYNHFLSKLKNIISLFISYDIWPTTSTPVSTSLINLCWNN